MVLVIKMVLELEVVSSEPPERHVASICLFGLNMGQILEGRRHAEFGYGLGKEDLPLEGLYNCGVQAKS